MKIQPVLGFAHCQPKVIESPGEQFNLICSGMTEFKVSHLLFIPMVSDFLNIGEGAEWSAYERTLVVTNRRHDLVAVRTSDPREWAWQNAGLIALEDAESGQVNWVDTGSHRWQELFESRAAAHRQQHREALRRARVDGVEFILGEDYVRPLLAFFDMRARRWGR